jgi:hypothetical protein
MSNEIILNADLRVRTGTNKTREIRREGLYGSCNNLW